jgi:hypothetical protein
LRIAAIAALRRVPMTAAEISELFAMELSTVSAVLLRIGLGKRSRVEPLEPEVPDWCRSMRSRAQFPARRWACSAGLVVWTAAVRELL